MPRKPRLFFPNQAVHLVVRGHNRDPVIARRRDGLYFVECMQDAALRYGVAVHAWVLMSNHLHLLATPADEKSLSKMMQSLGRRYARYFNRCYCRSGALWEGRFKTSLIDSDRYLLLCYRYIELNPVRAGMVIKPEDYPWSSYRANALDLEDSFQGEGLFITEHSVFTALASSVDERRRVYQSLFDELLPRRDEVFIRRGIERNAPVGNPEFLLKVAR